MELQLSSRWTYWNCLQSLILPVVRRSLLWWPYVLFSCPVQSILVFFLLFACICFLCFVLFLFFWAVHEFELFCLPILLHCKLCESYLYARRTHTYTYYYIHTTTYLSTLQVWYDMMWYTSTIVVVFQNKSFPLCLILLILTVWTTLSLDLTRDVQYYWLILLKRQY